MRHRRSIPGFIIAIAGFVLATAAQALAQQQPTHHSSRSLPAPTETSCACVLTPHHTRAASL